MDRLLEDTQTTEFDLPSYLESIRPEIETIFSHDQRRLEKLVEQQPFIDALAHTIKNGGVIVADFGPVVGYLCDGTNTEAIEQINRYKQMPSHTFALVTTPTLFPNLIDQQHTPKAFVERAKKQDLPQGFHFRVRANEIVENGNTTIKLPTACYSVQNVGNKEVPMIQIALFGEEASPELAYLLQILWHKQRVPYVIATSANIHGQNEISVYRKGKSLATEHSLPFINVGPDPSIDEIQGSFGGAQVNPEPSDEVFEKVIHLFRRGHLDTNQIQHLFSVTDIQLDPEVSASRYAYPPIEDEVLAWIFSQPARLRLQLLRATVHMIDISNNN